MNEHKALLVQLINSWGPLPDDAVEAFCIPWQEIKVPRKHILTRQGETEKYLYFVIDGIQRAWFEKGDKDYTLVFSYAPSFSGIIDSFFLQKPSPYYLETITSSHLMRISFQELDKLIKEHRSIETWVRIALTHVLSNTLERQIELQAMSAEEKFLKLLHRSPHILNLIPHKYIASYIGLDPTNFSKLLGKVKL